MQKYLRSVKLQEKSSCLSQRFWSFHPPSRLSATSTANTLILSECLKCAAFRPTLTTYFSAITSTEESKVWRPSCCSCATSSSFQKTSSSYVETMSAPTLPESTGFMTNANADVMSKF